MKTPSNNRSTTTRASADGAGRAKARRNETGHDKAGRNETGHDEALDGTERATDQGKQASPTRPGLHNQ